MIARGMEIIQPKTVKKIMYAPSPKAIKYKLRTSRILEKKELTNHSFRYGLNINHTEIDSKRAFEKPTG